MIANADKTFENKRLDSFITDFFFESYLEETEETLTRSKVQGFINQGCVKVNGRVEKSSYKLKENDVVEFLPPSKKEIEIEPKNIPLEIVYEDDSLIVLNKQKGLICHPTAHNRENTLVNALLYHTKNLSDIQGGERRGIVHRLDSDTTGLMIAAKTNEAHIKLQKDIQTKKTVRKYLAVVYGEIEQNEGIIDKPLVHYLGKTVKMNVSDAGLNAVTEFKVKERFKGATFLELKLQTGRTHQIRCHLDFINHPVIGDKLYGGKGFFHSALRGLKLNGQVLMSYYLSFTHPVSGEIMEFEIGEENYHPELKKVLNVLRSLN